MSRLKEVLDAGGFALTAELGPPKGTDFSRVLGIAEVFGERLDAINVTDYQSASVKTSALSVCVELQRMGLESVIQMTGRDRNRIATQGEMIAAGHFGINNLLAITGDHTTTGDNPEAMPVFELDAVSILQVAEVLKSGQDLAGNVLDGAPDFFLGAIVTPVFEPIEVQLIKMRKKIKAGARFFQTQGVYDIETMRNFKELTKTMDCYVLCGIIPLTSARMARFMNGNIPGIAVPENLIIRMEEADDPRMEGIRIAGEFAAQIKDEGLCEGVHIMAIGAEKNVPKILDIAGL